MEEPLSLTLLYTANIGGDLALLPRLYTFLQRLRPVDSQHTLLLDLGGSSSESVWHCRATGNRSTLIVLDGMGYHAANTEGTLDAGICDKLAEQVTMALVDERHDWRYLLPPTGDPEICLTLRPTDHNASLQINLTPYQSTCLEGNTLRLQNVAAGQVGQVEVKLARRPQITAARIHAMPADTPPNPSIAGAVDFVEGEARFFLKQQNRPTP